VLVRRILAFPRLRRASVEPSGGPAAELSLETIYREHFDFVHRIARKLGGPDIDAEDVTQEVFLVADRRLHTFNNTSQMSTWLYGITQNIVRLFRRRARQRRFFFDVEEKHPDVAVESVDAVEVRQAHRIAYAILDTMSPKKREVFILAEFEQMSCEEIAEAVGAKTQTVWSRLFYARKEFSERLEQRVR
jgi:RNA polymerase sigma-70 factor (ECF subfamily)